MKLTEPETIMGNEVVHKKNGFKYWLDTRIGDWALIVGKNRFSSLNYEVVKIRKHKKDVKFPGGGFIPAGKEYFPGNEDWGTFGFTFMTRERAFKELEDVCLAGSQG